MVDTVLNTYEIKIEQEDINKFVKYFDLIFLTKIETPRNAVRFINSISFSMPLLSGEVNMGELMLVEGMKIFLPNQYKLIRDNSHIFSGIYATKEVNAEKYKYLFDSIAKTSTDLNEFERKNVEVLLKDLFPEYSKNFTKDKNWKLEAYFGDIATRITEDYAKWHKEKRIAVPTYFNRYFSYSVDCSQISDKEFNEFIQSILTWNKEDIEVKLSIWIMCRMGVEFISKVRNSPGAIPWDTALKLTQVLINFIGSEDFEDCLLYTSDAADE